MVGVPFINPLSLEGREMVRQLGSLEDLTHDNPELIGIVTRSKSQDISDDQDIPRNHLELALKRLEWYVKKRNNPNFNYRKYAFLFQGDIEKFDTISFYLLSQAIGVKFGPNSRESRLMAESQGSLIQNRLEELNTRNREEIVLKALQELLSQGTLKWTFFEDLLSSRRIQLSDLVLDQGEVIMDQDDFRERLGPRLHHRDPDKMYQLLIGEELRELILIQMVMQQTENYMAEVHEKSRLMVEPNPLLLQLADGVTEILTQPTPSYTGTGKVARQSYRGPLNREAFPPCVKTALEGIKSGGRNDAIVLFITPFVSYARLCPDIFKQNVTVRVSDKDPQLQVVHQEVLPLIYEAAERCVPPLFEDQPQEKININAKIGFGMHSTLKLENEGETKWYTPMSCEKIKLHLPYLCRPDDDCKKIGNPLIYYNRKNWILSREQAESGDKKEDEGYSGEEVMENQDNDWIDV
ncbi:MAG: DNA primase [Euryarchaeota archaeon]|jgi:DNA primase large subunit|nr:DNA primase [Euryarchaeota archaeon]